MRRPPRRHGARWWLWAAAAASLLGPVALSGQDALDRACTGYVTPTLVAECRLAAGSARILQPRLAAALWGGNPVAGTASTLGMRIGTLPRFTVGGRVTVAPVELPPLQDRTASEGSAAVFAGGALDGALAVHSGFSPAPTVGGVLSVDVLARIGYVPLRRSRGFTGGAAGLWLGTRIGVLRESFTLPGISATASYGRIGRIGYGDPEGGSDGYFTGAVNDLGLDVAVSKRVALLDVTGGAAYHRFSSDVRVGFRELPGAPQLSATGQAVHERWNAYLNLGMSMLIFHGSGEIGFQQAPVPAGLPPGVDLDPIGWYGGIAFRVSI